MAFNMSVQKCPGKILEVEIGIGDKAIKIGGENALPFYSFDGYIGNTPKVGIEILDVYPEEWTDEFKQIYINVCDHPVKWAKYIEENINVDFICLKLESCNPKGVNRSPDECAQIVKEVVESVSLPMVIAGCGNYKKDAKVFEKVAQLINGNNCLFLAITEENYKEIGVSSALAYNHKIIAQSYMDINQAKQLNVLLNKLGVKSENIVMNIGCLPVGYACEYVLSTIERIKLTAFNQNEKMLQMPIITPVSFETWVIKESIASDEDEPKWGDIVQRGINMEISTAISALTCGSNAVILRHPKSVETIKELVSELV